MAATDRTRLMRLLRAAHAGERAAAFAYQGHGRSVRDPGEREAIRRIEQEEWAHRRRLGEMLVELGTGPAPAREVVFGLIGRCLSALCHISGWTLPMYGAGWIEARNVVEYVIAAEWARRAGLDGYARELTRMADCEREHEIYFRTRVEATLLARVVGLWARPTMDTHLPDGDRSITARHAGPHVAAKQVLPEESAITSTGTAPS